MDRAANERSLCDKTAKCVLLCNEVAYVVDGILGLTRDAPAMAYRLSTEKH